MVTVLLFTLGVLLLEVETQRAAELAGALAGDVRRVEVVPGLAPGLPPSAGCPSRH